MANFKTTYKDFTGIAFPYFRSEDRWAGRVLLSAVIALQLFQVWLNVQFNTWYNTFYTALQNRTGTPSSGRSGCSACLPPSSS
jgi:putative ATP-binding cassette transporter